MTIITESLALLRARLVAFGLSDGEASVYVSLLEYGKELGGTKLALRTGLHRQYIYIALPKLLDLGLIEEVASGTRSKYRARPPQELERIGRKRALEASDLARDLNQISNIGNEQEFEVIQGARAISEHELTYATRAVAGSDEYIIGGASEQFGTLMGDNLEEYLSLKREQDIHVHYLGTEDERDFYKQFIGKYQNQEYRFLEKLPKGRTHTVIRTDTVSFYTFLNPPLVYVVKSTVIAQNYRDFFMMLWKLAET